MRRRRPVVRSRDHARPGRPRRRRPAFVLQPEGIRRRRLHAGHRQDLPVRRGAAVGAPPANHLQRARAHRERRERRDLPLLVRRRHDVDAARHAHGSVGDPPQRVRRLPEPESGRLRGGQRDRAPARFPHT
jgi:hypothetical protein